MKPRTSEVFENYVKIAEEVGMVEKETKSPEKSKESPKLRKYKKSPHPRVGSDDIDTIEALYNVKPDSITPYENCIMEVAHPKPVVIAPAYDRLNALVENNIERQNIMSNIALKPNDGIASNHRYAQKELVMQLVRIANDMDNRGNEELRALADECIEKLSAQKKSLDIEKVAFLPWIIGGAVVLAAMWFWGHADDPDKGLTANIENSIKELDDLKTNSWYESDVDEEVQSEVSVIEGHLNELAKSTADFNAVISSIQKPRSASDVGTIQKMSIHSNVVDKVLMTFIKQINEITPLLVSSIKNFTSKSYQLQHSKSSWLGNATGWLGEALHGRYGLIANDFISASNALGTLVKSLATARSTAQNIDAVKEKYQGEIEQEVSSYRGSVSAPPSSPTTTPVSTQSDNKEDYSGLFNAIGHEPSKDESDFFAHINKK